MNTWRLSMLEIGQNYYTEGEPWDDLKLAIQDALACHFEDEQKPGDELVKTLFGPG